jgi:cytochrome P450
VPESGLDAGEGALSDSLSRTAEVDAGAIARSIVDPETYVGGVAADRLFALLRATDPVHWTEPQGVRPFWTVSKHADIVDIERQHRLFLNAPRLILATCEEEERVRQFTGGTHLLVRTIVSMDGLDHRQFRALTQEWFTPRGLRAFEAEIDRLAGECADAMAARDSLDFAEEIAARFPLRVIMLMLGIPPEDEKLIHRLTSEIFGVRDPDLRRRGSVDGFTETMAEMVGYFSALLKERQRRPKADLASVVANASVGGKPIDPFDAVSYCIIIATAGHETTSSALSGGLLALIEHPGELDRLRANVALLPLAIEEVLRWVTPVKHFFRTAAEDCELRGQRIRGGDALLLSYPSANRDEEVFEAPLAFMVHRNPNRHLAFGSGVHLCLGQHLARRVINALFSRLLARLGEVRLDSDPVWRRASFVGGLKHLPIRYRMT